MIAQIVRQQAPASPISIETMDEKVRDDLAPTRIGALVALALAMLALALAAVGIYGVTAFAVTQRTREIGIRLALGAEPAAVRWGIVRSAMRPVAIGAAIGVPVAATGALVAAKFIIGAQPLDPVAYLAVCAFLALVAFVASYMPARRATRVSPATVLRQA
jgi:ABC-type antimicrobial peptide transport system permease subunit